MKRFIFSFIPCAAAILACISTVPAATPAPAESPLPAAKSVWVYYMMSDDENMTPVPVARSVPDADPPAVLTATLTELVKGPTDAEKAAGLTSWFSPATADAVAAVSGGGSEYSVDFDGLNALIPNASTSAGSRMLLSQLNSTVFQFDFIQTVHYSVNGDCAKFWEWLQMGCHPVTRAEWQAG
jgi:spore germination protein GerM